LDYKIRVIFALFLNLISSFLEFDYKTFQKKNQVWANDQLLLVLRIIYYDNGYFKVWPDW
jgi:hypothetical protein